MLERVRTSAKPTWFDSDKCFIDGRWVDPQSGRRLPNTALRIGPGKDTGNGAAWGNWVELVVQQRIRFA
jgi:hypothetical protein